MVSFNDFNYSGYVDDKKSTSGYIFMMAEGAVSWKKKESSRHLQLPLLWRHSMWCVVKLPAMQELHFSFEGCSLHFQTVEIVL